MGTALELDMIAGSTGTPLRRRLQFASEPSLGIRPKDSMSRRFASSAANDKQPCPGFFCSHETGGNAAMRKLHRSSLLVGGKQQQSYLFGHGAVGFQRGAILL